MEEDMVYFVGGIAKNTDETFTCSLWRFPRDVAEDLQIRGRQIEEKENDLRTRGALRDHEDKFAKIQREAYEGMIKSLRGQYNNIFSARKIGPRAEAILSQTGKEQRFKLYDTITEAQVQEIIKKGSPELKITFLKNKEGLAGTARTPVKL